MKTFEIDSRITVRTMVLTIVTSHQELGLMTPRRSTASRCTTSRIADLQDRARVSGNEYVQQFSRRFQLIGLQIESPSGTRYSVTQPAWPNECLQPPHLHCSHTHTPLHKPGQALTEHGYPSTQWQQPQYLDPCVSIISVAHMLALAPRLGKSCLPEHNKHPSWAAVLSNSKVIPQSIAMHTQIIIPQAQQLKAHMHHIQQ